MNQVKDRLDKLLRQKAEELGIGVIALEINPDHVHLFVNAMPVAREIVNRVMLSISEGDAVPLEKSLRVLRQNAHDGLEHLAKSAQPQPD